jgi:hypothetical protein
MGAAAPTPPHHECSSPLMGVGATPRRVAPRQGGFRDSMYVLTQSSIEPKVNSDEGFLVFSIVPMVLYVCDELHLIC